MIAFVIIVIVIAAMAVGWLITGKTKIDKCDENTTKDNHCDSEPADTIPHNKKHL